MKMFTGDLKPDLRLVLSSQLDGINVGDALDVKIVAKDESTDEVLFSRTPSSQSVEGTGSEAVSTLTMEWQPSDTAKPRVMLIEVEITWPPDKVQTLLAVQNVTVRADFNYTP